MPATASFRSRYWRVRSSIACSYTAAGVRRSPSRSQPPNVTRTSRNARNNMPRRRSIVGFMTSSIPAGPSRLLIARARVPAFARLRLAAPLLDFTRLRLAARNLRPTSSASLPFLVAQPELADLLLQALAHHPDRVGRPRDVAVARAQRVEQERALEALDRAALRLRERKPRAARGRL